MIVLILDDGRFKSYSQSMKICLKTGRSLVPFLKYTFVDLLMRISRLKFNLIKIKFESILSVLHIPLYCQEFNADFSTENLARFIYFFLFKCTHRAYTCIFLRD